MNKLHLTLTITLLLNFSFIYAQNELNYGGEYEKKNNLYGDIGFGFVNLAGNLRLNYERQILKKESINLVGRTGVGYWFDWTSYGIEIPLTVQAIFFKSASHLELGMGVRWYSDIAENKSKTPFTYNFGYRYQKPEKSLLFRVNAEYNGWYLIPTLSIGTSF